MGFENFAHRKERTIHHHRGHSASGLPQTALLGHRGRSQSVRQQVAGAGVRRQQSPIVVRLHAHSGRINQGIKLRGFAPVGQQGRPQLGEGVLSPRLVEVVAVPLHAHARSVVVQKRNLRMNQDRSALLAHGAQHVFEGRVAGRIIGSVHLHDFDSLKALRKLGRIAGPHLVGLGRNVPTVVLHQNQKGQLLERRHLKRFTHLSLGHGRIANRAKGNGSGSVPFFSQSLLLAVLNTHGGPCRGNRLHTRRRGLVRNLRLVGIAQRGVAVVGASAREGIVALGQKLQHKIIGAHANAQKHGVVAVVGVNEVCGL